VDKIITTTLLIIAGIVCTMLVFNTAYPMVSRSTQAMVSTAEKVDDRMVSRVNIVHAANTANRQTVYIWVKNIGSSRILSIEESDVFFGQEDDFCRIPHDGDAGEEYPRWEYSIENNTEWVSGATLKITITYTSDPGAGTYYIKIVIPNGVMDEYYFSM
jgi:archaellum component FlaF (FlaF/FlaG flagellin family)